MSERQQNVAPRARRTAAKAAAKPAPRTAPVRRRARLELWRWVRAALLVALVALPFAVYLFAAESDLFSLKRIEVVGATRAENGEIEEAVRTVAGSHLLGVDLDEVRAAVENERYVASASVVRILPHTLRVEVREREPAVVIRLDRRLAWASTDGHVLGDFRPERGDVPPPLAGFDPEPSERALADNRDRIAAYLDVREALAAEGLWDRLDEVNIKYLQNVKVRLADSGLEVWLGHRDFHSRLSHALVLRDAVVRGDLEVLSRYQVINDPTKLFAAPDSYTVIDASGGKFNFIEESSGHGARRN